MLRCSRLANLIILLALSSCSNRISIPHGTNSYYEGNIVTGSKFGFTVGAKARPNNANDLTYMGHAQCDFSLHQLVGCSPSDTFMIFDIKQRFRHGGIYLKVRDNSVQQIVWQTSLFRIES